MWAGALGRTTAQATTEGGRPGAPTGLTATANGRTRIDLSWTAPTNTAGGITGYRIEVSDDEGDSWDDHVANTNSTRTSYSHRNLSAGTRRDYRVSAISSGGAGDPSNEAHATTDVGRPSAPLALSATADGRTRIRARVVAPPATTAALRLPVTGLRFRGRARPAGSW